MKFSTESCYSVISLVEKKSLYNKGFLPKYKKKTITISCYVNNCHSII